MHRELIAFDIRDRFDLLQHFHNLRRRMGVEASAA